MYVPFTGLGLYGGFRGNRWLKNRIKVFTHFVVPSLLAQTSKNFVIWISWRPEDRDSKHVQHLEVYLREKGFKVVFTFQGVCFWDDKYPDDVARDRLLTSLQKSLPALFDEVGQADEVLMTIQPSDDCYHKETVGSAKKVFMETNSGAVIFTKGYIMNYTTKEVCEYNPTTIPPFFTIRFKKDVFLDPRKHIEYTGPYKSHEYIGDKLTLANFQVRGFLVGTHGENISTHFNHPFKGPEVDKAILADYGLADVPPIEIKISLRKILMRKLPYGWQRKLRYWLGERLYQKVYEFLRG